MGAYQSQESQKNPTPGFLWKVLGWAPRLGEFLLFIPISMCCGMEREGNFHELDHGILGTDFPTEASRQNEDT